MKYSVLMSVYQSDDPAFFGQAIESMLHQTVPCDEFVLVCDGELTEELDAVIERYDRYLKVVRLGANVGLGVALNKGLEQCENKLVARMDSDDISLPDRCEKELRLFEEDPSLTIVSGSVQEFSGDPDGEKHQKKRKLPLTHEDIVRFSLKRNPFNHPAVMYQKSAVFAAGGYVEEYHLFEDYDLWVRMLKNGAKGRNLPDVLLKMRVSDALYMRRGGWEYTKNLLRFHHHLRKTGWISTGVFVSFALPHAFVCILPNKVRKIVYQMLRKS